MTTLVGLTEDTSEAAALLDLDLGANNTAGGCFPASSNRLVSTSSWKITKHTNITGPWIPVKIMKSHWKSCATGFIISGEINQGTPTVKDMESNAFISL